MMYQEFLSLTSRKVSYEKYTNDIEPAYMESPLTKQEFCQNYIEQTSRTIKPKNSNYYNKDKFIKAVKFETALKALSKMVQEKDGDIFYMDDIIWNRERFLQKWKNEIEENQSRMFPLKEYELRERIAETGESFRTFASETEYYDYWKTEEGTFFRLQIELQEDGMTYIDCGYRN